MHATIIMEGRLVTDPEIKSGDRIKLLESGAVYDIIGQPENIELRNQEMSFKVNRIKGGA